MKNPKLISKPFAQNGQKNVIPEKYETSMESNQATWDQGFGQITMLPVSAGGLPPKGQDFNGILNQISETLVHISKGGVFKFSADYAVAINGYPKGAILQSEDEKKYYQSLIDNNKVNFNTASQDKIKTSWKLVMTNDLLDQLSKKLESSAIVQSTGTSTTSVMSQKASTDAFQQKGDYATNNALKSGLDIKLNKTGGTLTNNGKVLELKNTITSSLYIQGTDKDDNAKWRIGNTGESGILAIHNVTDNTYVSIEGNSIKINGGTVATENNVESKISASIAQTVGNSKTQSISQNAATQSFQPKGSYQPVGNYALVGDSYTKIESDNRYQPKGSYQISGYSYSKSESDNKYQPKGSYATTTELSSGLSGKLNNSGGTLANNGKVLELKNTSDDPSRTALYIQGSKQNGDVRWRVGNTGVEDSIAIHNVIGNTYIYIGNNGDVQINNQPIVTGVRLGALTSTPAPAGSVAQVPNGCISTGITKGSDGFVTHIPNRPLQYLIAGEWKTVEVFNG